MQRLTLPWLAFALWLPAFAHAQAPQEVELVPGQTKVRRIGGGARHVFRFQLNKGEFARIAVAQHGVELDAAVADHARQQVSLGAVMGPVSRFSIPVLAAESGTHWVMLKPLQGTAPEREYEIWLSPPGPPTPQQQAAVRAWHLLREASTNQASMTGEERKQGIARAERALAEWRAAGDRDGELATLITLAYHQRAADNHREVVKLAAAALPLARGDAGMRSAEAIVLNQGGLAKLQTGAGEAGLADLAASHTIWRALGDAAGLAYITAQLGYAHSSLGDWKNAEPLLREAVAHSQATGDARLVASSQITLARLLSRQKQHREAIASLEQALEFYNKAEDLRNQAFVLNRMGEEWDSLGDKARAFERFEAAAALSRRAGNPSVLTSALMELVQRHRRAGQPERAMELIQEVIGLERAIGDPSGEAVAHGRLGAVERDMGRLADARREVAEAVRIVESIRAGLANPNLRTLSTSQRAGAYELQIDILHRSHLAEPAAGFAAEALLVSERSRARGLLDTLVAAQVNLREGVDPALLNEQSALLQRLAAKAAEQRKLAMASAKTEVVRAEIDALASAHDRVEARIRMASPRYSALAQPPQVSVEQIQRELLDADTALVEYFLGPQGLGFAWVVTPAGVAMEKMPPRKEVEPLVRAAYEALTARNRRGLTADKLAKADAAVEPALAALRAALVTPLAKHFAGKARLLVVSDGPLDYIPFALLAPAEMETVRIPSATVLSLIRQQAAARQPAERGLAIFADPVFDAGDPRVTGAKATPASALPKDLARRGLEAVGIAAEGERLPRLLFTRREAEAIAQLAPAEWKVLKSTDFAATREAVLGGELARYRILHFATHGMLNNDTPELSGLVLSLVDRRGAPVDGFVRLADLYRLRLPADLVVLSACQTALGKEMGSEGLVGLTRGMIHAGASRVVASLWKVDDAATAELMKHFYTALRRPGVTAAAALRAAQEALRKQPRWQAPYYWAAFLLQGEYR